MGLFGLGGEDAFVNTLLGTGSRVLGDVTVEGFIRVDGDVDGNIATQGHLIVGDKARIRGNVVARSAVVAGIVLGNIDAEDDLVLLESAAVIGDITTHSLKVADKVVIHGYCNAALIEDNNTHSRRWRFKKGKNAT